MKMEQILVFIIQYKIYYMCVHVNGVDIALLHINHISALVFFFYFNKLYFMYKNT